MVDRGTPLVSDRHLFLGMLRAPICFLLAMSVMVGELVVEGAAEGKWFLGVIDEHCNDACNRSGGVCDTALFHQHNDEVDSKAKIETLLQTFNITFNNTGIACVDNRTGSGPGSPQYRLDRGVCVVSQPNRNVSTFSCSRVPNPAGTKQRLCMCDVPPAPTTTVAGAQPGGSTQPGGAGAGAGGIGPSTTAAGGGAGAGAGGTGASTTAAREAEETYLGLAWTELLVVGIGSVVILLLLCTMIVYCFVAGQSKEKNNLDEDVGEGAEAVDVTDIAFENEKSKEDLDAVAAENSKGGAWSAVVQCCS